MIKSKYLYVIFAVFQLVLLGSSQALGQKRNKKTGRQVEALMKEKRSRTLIEQKIDSQLLQAIKEFSGKKMAKGAHLEPSNVHADKNGNLAVDISAKISDELLEKIKELGGQIIFPSRQYNTVRAQVHITKIIIIAAYEEVKFVQAAMLPLSSDGGTSQINFAGKNSETSGN